MTTFPNPINQARLAAADRRERRLLLALVLPAALVVALVLGLPTTWLFGLSFWQDGPSLVHYERLVADPSYARSLVLTLQIAVQVTAIVVLLGYPLTFVIVGLPPAWRGLALACVLIPFWTAILVRTYAWMVLLQRRGLINSWLVDIGAIDEPLALVHNTTGTVIGMVHVLLPFLVLPLYASMQRLDLDLVRAAAALGATPLYAFRRIFFPLTAPGLLAGSFLVFILALGFYITPELMGGGKTVMISMLIQRNVELYFQWGAASAVGVVLVLVVVLLLVAIGRVVPVERIFGAR